MVQNVTVVLGEDDDGHALLVCKNLERVGLTSSVRRLRDGGEVLDFFEHRRSLAAEAAERVLLLLDIHMPRVDGIEVLRRLKQDAATAKIPVIMLTTTDDPREVARCYELGCNIYLTKPIVYEHFVDAVTRLGMFLVVVKVP